MPFYLTELRGLLRQGEKIEMPLALGFAEVEAGVHTAVFTYQNLANAPVAKREPWKYPPALWTGSISSAPVQIEFEPIEGAPG
ncbi:MAG TPA: hypothetical protein VG734_16815 [Lacunisphaera sp.]|nr:hypothetical protein [Lacunisphaera sp.]